MGAAVQNLQEVHKCRLNKKNKASGNTSAPPDLFLLISSFSTWGFGGAGGLAQPIPAALG